MRDRHASRLAGGGGAVTVASANLRARGYPGLGPALRLYRVALGWSLEDLNLELREAGCGIYLRLLGRYERGEIVPSVPTLIALARILETSLDALVAKADRLAEAYARERD